MRGKYLSVALATGFLAAVAAGQAKAEILNLDCTIANSVATYRIWVDFDRNTLWRAIHFSNDPSDVFVDLESGPATITVQYVEAHLGIGNTDEATYIIDRVTGLMSVSGGYRESDQCVKSSYPLPLPATKF